MYKYVIEVLLRNGTWIQGAIWTCHPSNFRAFLNHFIEMAGPTLRIKRAPDHLEADLQWPIG